MSYNDDQSYIPGWNGDPATWEEFEEQVRFFKLASDMTRSRSFAAAIVMKLTGTAKSIAKEIPDEELLPFTIIPVVEGEGEEVGHVERKPHHWAAANNLGIKKLMDKLKEHLCIQKPS